MSMEDAYLEYILSKSPERRAEINGWLHKAHVAAQMWNKTRIPEFLHSWRFALKKPVSPCGNGLIKGELK